MLIVGYNGRVLALHPTTLATIWNLDLDRGCHVVNVSVKHGTVYAGCYGRLFKIDRNSGSILDYNTLSKLDYREVRIAFETGPDNIIVVGTYGHARGIYTSTMKQAWTVSLPGCGHEVVNVICDGEITYAGSNSFLYLLDRKHSDIQGIRLTPDGNYEVRMAFVDNQLIAAGHGYVKSFALDNLGKQNWAKRPSQFGTNDVSVVKAGQRLVYASTGHFVYGLDTRNGDIVRGGQVCPAQGAHTNITMSGPNAVIGNQGSVVCSTLPIHDFTMQEQEEAENPPSLLCWAAVTASISLYYDRYSGAAQCKLVQTIFGIEGNLCCDAGTPVPDICNRGVKGLRDPLTSTGNYRAGLDRPTTIKELAEEMRLQRPIAVTIAWPDTDWGHTIVITGVFPRYTEDEALLKYYDPGSAETSDHLQYMTYGAMKTRYDGAGIWASSYATKPKSED